MAIAFISESHIGSHIPPLFKGDFISLQGSRGVIYTSKGFDLSPELKDTLSGYKTLIVGTDLDVIGTKTATVIKDFAQKRGIKTVRLALTEKGYRAGEFFTKEQMKALHDLATLNRQYYRRHGYSLQAIVVLGRAYRDSLKLKSVKVKNKKGTSTITTLVKLSRKGVSIESGMKTLQYLYKKGEIEYPRVDNDYITQKPFDLYPHPPLTTSLKRKKKKIPDFLTPFEEDELPLRRETYLLRLSNLRLITPSSAVKYYKLLCEFFDERMKPYPERVKTLKKFAKISEYFENDILTALETVYYPQRKLLPLPPEPELEFFNELQNNKASFEAFNKTLKQ